MRNAPCLIFLVLMVQFCSCFKKGTDNCEEIQQIKITGAKNQYYVGESISLGVNELATTALYLWSLGDNPNLISSVPTVFIYECDKGDEGWYRLSISHPDCKSNNDSVFISVKNKPATAPCNPANNSVTFSAMPDINFGSVTFAIDNVYARKNLKGHTAFGYPDLNIYFNLYWNKEEPEDGEYSIGNALSLSDFAPYTVYMTTKYSDILFNAALTGKVYVSHVNGKLQAKFCDIDFSGSYGGIVYRSKATGTITAP